MHIHNLDHGKCNFLILSTRQPTIDEAILDKAGDIGLKSEDGILGIFA
jgi:hypothetical protein